MIVLAKKFPDLTWLKHAATHSFQNERSIDGSIIKEGWPTVLLNVKNPKLHARENILGPFSLFYNLKGSSFCRSSEGESKIDGNRYFLSNADDHYDLIFEETASETLNIHFSQEIISKTYSIMMSSEADLVEENKNESEVNFFSKSYQLSSEVKAYLNHIYQNYFEIAGDKNELEYVLIKLVEQIILEQKQEIKLLDVLSCKNWLTKVELAKNIYRAKDFIYTYYFKSLSLDQIAQAAGLSKYHLLRIFKLLTGQSPLDYQHEIRLQKSLDFLQNKEINLDEMALSLGYSESSSFCRKFKSHFGLSPRKYQSMIIK